MSGERVGETGDHCELTFRDDSDSLTFVRTLISAEGEIDP